MADKGSGRPPVRKTSGRNPRMIRQSSLGSVGDGEAGESSSGGRNKRLANIRPRISIEELRSVYRRQASQTQDEADPIFDPLAKAQASVKVVRGKTGVVYDEKMAKHCCLWDKNYPECPDRLLHVLARCKEMGLLEERCQRLPSREATEEEVLSNHTRTLLSLLTATRAITNPATLEDLAARFDSVYLHPSTCETVLLAAGSTLELLDEVVAGKLQNGFALVRPPGHHATESEFCGFCFLNNTALAAKRALEHHKLSRILVIDWDVHHGQATQQAFYSDPRVLYFSIHRYENGSFWPHLRESNYDYAGEGAGRGFNFNLPLNTTGMTNSDYLAVFHQLILPVAYEFNPELVLVSAGYDAALCCSEFMPELLIVSAGYDSAYGDNKGEMEVSPGLYSHLISCLMTLAGGKVLAILEGGYCLESLAEGAAMTLSALLGDPCPQLLDSITQPSQSIQVSILNLIYVHRKYWKCFQYQGSFSAQDLVSKEDGGGAVVAGALSKTEASMGRPRHIPTLAFHGLTGLPPLRYETRNLHNILQQDKLSDAKAKLALLKEKECIRPLPTHKLSLTYDTQMTRHHSLTEGEHPERPERIERIWECLKQYGILDRTGVTVLQSRRATQEEVELVHTSIHIDMMKTIGGKTEGELQMLQESFKSVYLHPTTNDCALLSTGCLLQVVDSVCIGEAAAGVGVIRPPGHHAEPHTPYGFCFYNNMAVAAQYAITKHHLQRVMILDWDVHHGNGIQHAFYNDRHVLYISIHRYDNAIFFPSSEDANYDHTGEGPGEGYNINIPWNKSGMGDAEYIAAMVQVVLPVAYQFNPQLVLVSAGFDAARGDPLGGCRVTPECYGHMTRLLMSLAEGRLVLGLEGGYSLSATSHSLTMCTKALLGDPLPSLLPNTPNKSAVHTINEVIHTHKKYWSALCFQVDLPLEDVLAQGLGGGPQSVDSGVSGSDVSSSNPSPSSSPSTGTSSPFVSAPSSPEKIKKPEECVADILALKIEPCNKMEKIEVEGVIPLLKPMQDNNCKIEVSMKGESPVSTRIAARAVQDQTNPTTNPKQKRRRSGRQEGCSDGSTPDRKMRLKTALDVAAASKEIVKGTTAIVYNLDQCETCEYMAKDNMSIIIDIEKRCREFKFWQRCNHILPVYTHEPLNAVSTCCVHHPVPARQAHMSTLLREVMSGQAQNGLAIFQSRNKDIDSSGPIDNLSIPVSAIMTEYDISRVLVVEWVGKENNSVQDNFTDDLNVLVISLHMYHGAVMPQRPDNNIAISLNGSDITSEDLHSIFLQVVLPVAYEFCPELVIVLGTPQLTLHSPHLHPIVHWHLTNLLTPLASGHLAVMMDVSQSSGSSEAVREGVVALLFSLLDRPLAHSHQPASAISPQVHAAIKDVIMSHGTRWNCLKNQSQSKIAAKWPKQQKCVIQRPKASCTNHYTIIDESNLKCEGVGVVCVGWDERTAEHRSHMDETHPERPQRLTAIIQCLSNFGLLQRCLKIKESAAVGKAELMRVHTAGHLKFMQSLRNKKPSELRTLEDKFDSIFLTRRTDTAATLAAGCTLSVVESVVRGESQRGLAVVRPPGHHAEPNVPCGFCFYNNVAVAAKHVIQEYKLQRVLIFDWDIHHGNGTQYVFENDPKVLYISIHRYENATFFPGSTDANYDCVGKGPGQGFNINIPWNKKGMGDGDYIAAMMEVVMPVALEFQPELVLVSAGFDAAVGDPLGGCQVTPECYGHMTRMLTTVGCGRVVVVLEGGYNLSSLGYCSALCTKALLGDPIPPLTQGLVASQSAVETLASVVSVHSKFWSSFSFKDEVGTSDMVGCSSSSKTDKDITLLADCLERVGLSDDGQGVHGESVGGIEELEGACGGSVGSGNTLLMELAAAQQLYAVEPASWCPHLELVRPLPDSGLDTTAPCIQCKDTSENWVCLTCFQVMCGRYVSEHMLMHGISEEHYVVLSYSDLSVWCYSCDTYLHNPVLMEAKRAAHLHKFGEEMPGS